MTRAKIFIAGMFCVFASHTMIVYATVKHEVEIFDKWHAWQQVYQDRAITAMEKDLDNKFLGLFKQAYEKNIINLKSLIPTLTTITNGKIQEDGFQLQNPLDDQMRSNLIFMYNQIESNMPGYVDCLVNSGMISSIMGQETDHHDTTIEKYKAFARLPFVQPDSFKENEYMLALSNRFAEYCFEDATFPHYQNMLTTHEHYPIARFLNSVIWYYLVGDGWKHWHADALNNLKTKAAQGHEIVYPAGGTDFYQLLREGIKNITIIDAFLPTQERFYSSGWRFLLTGENETPGIDDEIRFGPECNSIKMKRAAYKEGDFFHTKLSNGKILSVKKSITTWHLFDRNNEQVGHVIINRRPVEQDDFAAHPNRSLVMSYDEMTFIAVPDILNGWGIDPTIMPDNLSLYVKQMRKPMTKSMLCNIRIVGMLNLADLRFINLASDPT